MRSLGFFALIFIGGTLTAQQPQQPGPSIPAMRAYSAATIGAQRSASSIVIAVQ